MMMMQGRWAAAAAIASLGLSAVSGFNTSAKAQPLPPMYGPPPVYMPAYPPPHGARAMIYEGSLLPQEILGILDSTGYQPLALPVRQGRFYVARVLNPNGARGRITMDAMSGRFVRFIPADQAPAGPGLAGVYPPPPTSGPSGLRPPAPLPRVASVPTPASKPPQLANTTGEAKPVDAKPVDAEPVAAKPAEAKSAEAKPPETRPADVKPAVKLLPTQPMPPVQSFE